MKRPAALSSFDALIQQALAIEAEQAKDAGALGFMARAMAMASMPHSRTTGNEHTRRNGDFTLTMLAPSAIGLPYGALPRLLMAWVTTEAVRTRERELELGDTLSEFMRKLDLVPTGGRWGSITRLREQTRRLFAASVSCSYAGDGALGEMGFRIADGMVTWWDPKRPNQKALWRSTVTLSERFFAEVIQAPVPVDMRALRALRRSPMALDIYIWLTHRSSYLKRPTAIPWAVLQRQFGADYARVRAFREHFRRQLMRVAVVYPEIGLDLTDSGVELRPAPPHVKRLAGH